ncbi:hypothetical protein BKI49_22185 [Streptomyces sp. Tue6028]|nr:hypothetical protein BKI49_22185 [Streptomyces sp. Tue6028]
MSLTQPLMSTWLDVQLVNARVPEAPVTEHAAPPLAALALVTVVAANMATAATLVTERRFHVFPIRKR